MKKYTLIAAALLLLIACGKKLKPNEYTIEGNVTGYPDSTYIYFQVDTHQDSVLIIKNKFEVTGTLKNNESVQAMLHVKDTRDYQAIWLENAIMTFNAEKGKFNNAVVSGSKTQLLQDEINALTAPFNAQGDSINKLVAKLKLPQKEADIKLKIITNEMDTCIVRFMEKRPNSIVTANYLTFYAPTLGHKTTRRLYDLLTPEIKNSSKGKEVFQYLSVNKNIEIGKPFADLTQYDADGKAVKLSDFKGRVFLIDFWASWCHPCRAAHPGLINTYNVYKNNGFNIVAISVDDDKKEWLNALRADKLPYTTLSEKNGGENTAAVVYGINQYPTNYLVDQNGIIIAKNIEVEELGKTLMKLYHINGK